MADSFLGDDRLNRALQHAVITMREEILRPINWMSSCCIKLFARQRGVDDGEVLALVVRWREFFME